MNSLHSQRGLTLVELLVASALGMMLLGLMLGVALSNRRAFEYDIGRTRLNQNLRGAMDILGQGIREAGERLPSIFPAVEIINGGIGNDELVLRKNAWELPPVICTAIAIGSTNTNIHMADTATGTTVPACAYPGQQNSILAIQNQLAISGGYTEIYLFDEGTKLGEKFIAYSAIETAATNSLYLQRQAGLSAGAYVAGYASIYNITEWRFRLTGSVLEVVIDDPVVSAGVSPPRVLSVADGVDSFEVVGVLFDGTRVSSLTYTDSWTELAAIEISLTGDDKVGHLSIKNRTLTSQFFPRNVLSNKVS